jgi:hypothetical protein
MTTEPKIGVPRTPRNGLVSQADREAREKKPGGPRVRHHDAQALRAPQQARSLDRCGPVTGIAEGPVELGKKSYKHSAFLLLVPLPIREV